jgi:long-chain acyl-CoA synthetase
MVGVPALWELLHRRIKNRLYERSDWIGKTAENLIYANAWLRDKTPLNLGQVLFYPIHEGLGGRIRYFISGGSALSEKIQRDFRGLGFTILEGYGLTEASPVLTVTRPENKMLTGTVGKPLPGVEVRIADPDTSGVGEVIARGPNVMLGYYEDEAATRKTLIERWLYTGDLGRVDDDGNLYLVGRSKEIIVDTNGKNVYPDELEELYEDSPYIKELSIVGLPDGIGEKVACIVVPDDEYDISLSRAELHRLVEEHFREVSASLPYYKRVKVLHFTDMELPRTATRKVKRREVVQILESIEQSQKSGPRSAAKEVADSDSLWLLGLVATVANRPRSEVSIDTRLSELGFDSLMFVELASSIENAGGAISAPERFNEVQDIRELISVVSRRGGSFKQELRTDEPEKSDEIHVPAFVRSAGNKAGDALQRLFYDQFLRTHYEGQSNIPPHTNFLVAANHCSHLDMGLTKMALGESGKDLVALAAADYFFDTKYKRAVMENFTNLVPMERTGSLRQSLRHALSFLHRGYNALIFPEGTRSVTGIMADYKPVIGYLALHAKVGILPMFLYGTYEAMPKGTTFIKSRDIGARIGRFLQYEELEEMTQGMARAEAYRLIAAYVRHEVVNLRDRTRDTFDAKSLRKEMKNDRKSQGLETEEVEESAASMM